MTRVLTYLIHVVILQMLCATQCILTWKWQPKPYEVQDQRAA